VVNFILSLLYIMHEVVFDAQFFFLLSSQFVGWLLRFGVDKEFGEKYNKQFCSLFLAYVLRINLHTRYPYMP
jgi:hypothetical protein